MPIEVRNGQASTPDISETLRFDLYEPVCYLNNTISKFHKPSVSLVDGCVSRGVYERLRATTFSTNIMVTLSPVQQLSGKIEDPELPAKRREISEELNASIRRHFDPTESTDGNDPDVRKPRRNA